MRDSVFILAGGKSERFKPYGAHRPKCLAHFRDRSLVARHLASLPFLDQTSQVVISVGSSEAADSVLTDLSKLDRGLRVSVYVNDYHPHGVLRALAHLLDEFGRSGAVLLILGDMLFLDRSCEVMLPIERSSVRLLTSVHPASRTGSVVTRNSVGAVTAVRGAVNTFGAEQWCGVMSIGAGLVSEVAADARITDQTDPSGAEEALINRVIASGAMIETVGTGVCVNINTLLDLRYATLFCGRDDP